MSVKIGFENVVKKYGNNTVIPGLSLEINEGEFFTLLGPSGCGKTTLLRMIAGFNTIEGGKITFNGKLVNDLAPGKRNIGMVFQSYAIFPHMTVRKNVAFGLTNRNVPKEEINKRVDKLLKTVQIEEYQDRMPDNLSGGQQQRVALARAIVIEPDVLLMDEPLSNLNAKLRIDMRNAIKEIQHEVNITTVYVAHEQEEAMAISDRIAVMNKGVIQQVGRPQDIYQRPVNTFVATFIGHTNLIDGTISPGGGKAVLDIDGYSVTMDNLEPEYLKGNSKLPVKVSVRPEEFVLCDDEDAIHGTIVSSTFLGLDTHYLVQLKNEKKVEIVQQSTIEDIIRPGTKVSLKIKTEKINIYSEDGEKNLLKGVTRYE